jgi:hypothetical protein
MCRAIKRLSLDFAIFLALIGVVKSKELKTVYVEGR